MKVLVLLAALAPLPAHADLYRWVDRDTGMVKFSSYPPPWFGDPERERGAPPVEVIPYRGSAVPAKPATMPEQTAAPGGAPSGAVSALEGRRTGLLRYFAELPTSIDPVRDGPVIQKQAAAFEAVSRELDRLDPAGAKRRRDQAEGVFEALRRSLPK